MSACGLSYWNYKNNRIREAEYDQSSKSPIGEALVFVLTISL